ncbi:MAG: hypothetical protein GY950_07100, partial [bacterium]|nr:hypothetical protein [bacterium]
IGGTPPENVISTYIYSIYLDCILTNLCRKLEKVFHLPRLKRRVGIALAFGEVHAVQHRHNVPDPGPYGESNFTISSLISQKINIASRVESSNKDHINADISMDSSFVDQLYRFMFPTRKLPRELMKEFKTLKTKQERLEVINLLNSCDIDLLINYMGHHDFKGGGTVVHIVSPVLVTVEPDLENNVVKESEELRGFYQAVNQRLEKDIFTMLIDPLQTKLMELVKELEAL